MSERKIVGGIIALFFVLAVSVPLFYLPWNVFPYNIPKTALFQALVELIFFLWLALAITFKRYRPKMTPLLWGIAAYLAVLTITALAGIDPVRSLFSTEERAFGLITWYHLAALALVGQALYAVLPWRKIWRASFWTSIVTVLVALIQLAVPSLLIAGENTGRPGAAFGNPTFLAGYLLFNIFIAGYYLLAPSDKNKGRGAALLWATIIVDVAGIFITETRGDILGLFAGVLALIIIFAIRPPVFGERAPKFLGKKKFYGALLAILLVLGGGIWFTRSSSIWEHVPGIDRLKDLSLSGAAGGVGDDLLPREIALHAAWEGFKDKPVLGWGLENFNVVFNKYYDPRALEANYSETNFDKPHDVPLEQLVSGGVPLFVAYFVMLALLLYEAKKTRNAGLWAVGLSLVIAYFIRDLVIFDTIGPAMMFFMFIALVDGEYAAARAVQVQESSGQKEIIKKTEKSAGQKIGAGAAVPALIAAIILIYALNLTSVYAAYEQYEGYQQIDADPQSAIQDFRTAVTTWSPYEWDFTRDYANAAAESFLNNPGAIPTGEMQFAISGMESVAAAHPMDADNHYLLIDIYNLASAIDPKIYLAKAEQEAPIALALAPDKQEIYFYLARTKSLEGNNVAAEALLKHALDLDPNVADSHFYYGMLAFANGDSATGFSEVETAIHMGRPWSNVYEPRVAGDYFADAGHIPEAIDLYKAALAIEPGYLDAEAKLGVAYYIQGNRDLAKQYLSDAAQHPDFVNSPSFPQYKPILDALGIAIGSAPTAP